MNPQDSGYFNPSPPSRDFCVHKINKSSTKPQESYVALIARAILSSPNYQMLLVDIYEWIIKYSNLINNYTNTLKINCGSEIQTDEMEYHRRK